MDEKWDPTLTRGWEASRSLRVARTARSPWRSAGGSRSSAICSSLRSPPTAHGRPAGTSPSGSRNGRDRASSSSADGWWRRGAPTTRRASWTNTRPHGRAGRLRLPRRLPGGRRDGALRAGSRPGAGAGASRRRGARRGRPRVRDGRRDAHRARARRHAPPRRQPAHGRDALRRPALARRHGPPGRSSVGAALRHLARAVPAAAPVPLGPATRRWP